jgi:hypothetical protein
MQRSIAGFYKFSVREYKNILIFFINGMKTRINHGDMACSQGSHYIPSGISPVGVGLLRPNCLRDNQDFPPIWA